MLVLKSIVDLLYDGIDSVWSWTRTIYNSYGVVIVGLLTIIILISALGRYILRPFIGLSAGQTDTAVRLKNDRDYKEGMRRQSVNDRIYLKRHGYID